MDHNIGSFSNSQNNVEQSGDQNTAENKSTIHKINTTDNIFWVYILEFTKIIDYYAAKVMNKCPVIDKIQIVLYVTWLWALIGLYISKMFEYFFIQLLKIPDKFLALPIGSVKNTQGHEINILYAHNGNVNITNKFKLFMKLYWEKGGLDAAHDSNGFDFRKLSNVLGCSMLYCCYLLNDKTQELSPEQFLTNIKRFMIEQQSNGNCYKVQNSNRKKIPMRHVDFDE